MKKYQGAYFEGERSLFQERDAEIIDTTFGQGESPLKESRNLTIVNSVFRWKYPLWYSRNITVNDTIFETMSRSGIWYTKQITVNNSTLQAPKLFRRSQGINLHKVHFSDADETLWNCSDIVLDQVQARGDYFGMNSQNIKVDGLDLVGNYVFDGAKNIEVHNSRFVSKDAFWNCEHVTVYDSKINGEYLAWNSKDVTFVNCTIESHQGLCYLDGIKLINCKVLETDLAFEYCKKIDAHFTCSNTSIKNPISGIIEAKGSAEIIQDDPGLDTSKVNITVK